VLLTAFVGYAWARTGAGFDTKGVTQMVSMVFAPALIFSALTTADTEPSQLLAAAGAILLCMALAGLLGVALLRALKAPMRVYLPVLMFPNFGNMGAPICYFAFGDEGLAYAIAIWTAISVAVWTLGLWIASGDLSPRKALFQPPVLAAVAAIAAVGLAFTPPTWAMNSLELLAAPTIPLMLIALGVSLATMKVASVRLAVGLGAARLFGGMAIGFGVAEALQLEGVLRGVVILQSSMPSAVFNFLFAHIYDRRPEEVAGVIVASTAMSLVTIPLLLAYLMAGAP
ncbi:MAG: AEC family transporter, partial [Pseudomonadota bacterium]